MTKKLAQQSFLKMANNHGLRKKEISGQMRLMKDTVEIIPWQCFPNKRKKEQMMAVWINNVRNINRFNEYWIHLKHDDYALPE